MINAMLETDWEVIEVFGKPALFTNARVDPDTVPNNVFMYEIRHDDECRGIAYEIAPRILVNHWGTVLMLESLDLGADGFLLMTDDDINYGVDECDSINGFVTKYGKEEKEE